MNKKIFVSIAVLGLATFMSCSDSSGGSTSGGGLSSLPTIEGAPEKSTLTSNNQTPATPVQISEDLQVLAEMDEIGSTLGDIELTPTIPSFGSLAQNKANLARKNLVAWGACETYPSKDTTYTEDGMSYTESMKMLDGNGNAFKMCDPETQAEAESVMDQMDGMQMVMNITGTSDTVDMEMNMVMVMHMDFSNQKDPKLGMDAKANFLIDVKIPKPFNAYMELDMTMPATSMTSESEVDPEFTFTMVMWFQNGRYKCEIDYDVMSSGAIDSKLCDLENAGIVVGSLWNDDQGEMMVKDAAGKVISEDEIIDEQL